MRSFVAAAVLVALVGLAGVALADTQLGGQEAVTTVHGMSVDASRSAGDAGAGASASTKDTAVDAKAPTCTVKFKHTTNSGCETGAVTATGAAPPTLNVDVFTGFGQMEQAPSDASNQVHLATIAGSSFSAQTQSVFYAAAATGASLAALYGAWRVLKLLGLAGVMPLYSHIADDELLDDPNRAKIFALIRAEAGISTKDVADRLGLAWGTVTHHLGKLEKRRMVVSKKYGKYRRYFVNGATDQTSSKDALAMLRVPATAEVAKFIEANPGFTQKSVSQALGVSSSTILWHVKRLEQVGLVLKTRDGKTVRYFPGTGVPMPAPEVAPMARASETTFFVA